MLPYGRGGAPPGKGGFSMGKGGKIVVAVTVVAVAVFFYAYVSAQLSATLVSTVVDLADTRQSTFDAMAQALERGDLADVQFAELSGDAQDYAFITYTVQLEGLNLFPAEWAVLSLTPAEGDVVIIQGTPQDVSSFGQGQVTATLLTRRDQVQAQRHMWVEYYVLGRAHSAVVSGAQS